MELWQWFVPGVREYNIIKDLTGGGKKKEKQQSSGDRVSQAKDYLDNVVAGAPGGYSSPYSSQISGVQNELNRLNEKGFQYDYTKDTAWQQYKSRYERGANLASEDAAAQAASRSGGYASSWGESAGQTAYQATMSGLEDVANNLYNQAYGEYNQKKSDLSNQLSALQQQDALAQQAYQVNQAAYANQLAYAQNEYNSAVQQQQAEKNRNAGWFQSFIQAAASIVPWFFI